LNLAERVKKQTDKILRQQAQGPNAGVVVVVNAGDGTATVSNPSADLAKHKQSGDHDGRYARVFTDLDDVPSAYTGQAGKALLVNSEEDGLEFGEAGGGAESFVDLDDVPAAYTDQAGKVLAVNAEENALEFITPSSGASGSFDFGLITEASSYSWDWGTIV
jgi:hypothetical protein